MIYWQDVYYGLVVMAYSYRFITVDLLLQVNHFRFVAMSRLL